MFAVTISAGSEYKSKDMVGSLAPESSQPKKKEIIIKMFSFKSKRYNKKKIKYLQGTENPTFQESSIEAPVSSGSAPSELVIQDDIVLNVVSELRSTQTINNERRNNNNSYQNRSTMKYQNFRISKQWF